MAKEVVQKAQDIKRRKKIEKVSLLLLLLLLVILTFAYFVLNVVYNEGNFTISMDKNTYLRSNLVMYESMNDRSSVIKLSAEKIAFMDNISIKWLPSDITEHEGSHNGKNYIAYSFYMENQGQVTLNYWYSVVMDDVVKHADEALRIMIYVNDEQTVYAKGSSINGEAEQGTKKFRDDEDGTIILEQRKDMKAGDLDKITVVVWIEGDDPECVDALIGGHARLHMKLIEEHNDDTIKELE